MTISKQIQTIIFELILVAMGCLISLWTDWLIVIPIFFGLAIPLVNVVGSFKQKIILTLVISLSTTAILIATSFLLVRFNFDKYIFPGLLTGLAAVFILGVNGLLIDNFKLDMKLILLTFMLSGLSLPICIYFWSALFGDSLSDINSRLYGILYFWMTMTTIAISFGLEKKINS